MRLSRKAGLLASGSGPYWAYSGWRTVREIEVDGQARTLVTLRGGGQLTVLGDLFADVWLCGAGARGQDGVPGQYGGAGGGGAYAAEASQVRLRPGTAVVAAGEGQTTLFGGLEAKSASGLSGGCGGGAGAGRNVRQGGLGDGAGKVPFGLDAHFAVHCGAGGGGGYLFAGGGGIGGDGGTMGAGGGESAVHAALCLGGSGGVDGGGRGGKGFSGAGDVESAGVSADMAVFGAGGGGGGSGENAQTVAPGGNGSAGVIYLLLHTA